MRALLLACCLAAFHSASAAALPPPPKGWNSWDCDKRGLNETGALAIAANMAKYLLLSGYGTLMIDGGWSDAYFVANCTDCIDAFGRAQPNVEKWPSSAGGKGLKPFIDKVHAMGLKVGMHTLRGSISLAALNAKSPIKGAMKGATVNDVAGAACNWNKFFTGVDFGSAGGAGQLFLDSVYGQYAEWGLDFINNDCVFGGNWDEQLIRNVKKAIDKGGRPTTYSLSLGGDTGEVSLAMATNISTVADMYRVTGDWHDCASGEWGKGCGNLSTHFSEAALLQSAIGKPSYPDLDILSPYHVANDSKDAGFRFQMSLWSITKSPLFIGLDLRNVQSAEELQLRTNKEVLRLAHSSGNRQVSGDPDSGAFVWAANGGTNRAGTYTYVALLNNGKRAQTVGASLKDLDVSGSSCDVRDMWSSTNLPAVTGKLSKMLPAVTGNELYRLHCKTDDGGDDLAWQDAPQAWHQQTARIVDHRFSTFSELLTFATDAKAAGASVLMLIQLQKSENCPGSWYNGLQMCDHLNGSYPVNNDEGSLEQWQVMLKMIKPMRLMVWWNVDYWSVQGDVWKQAVEDQSSDVGKWFSYGPNPKVVPGCDGRDVCFKSGSTGKQICAQGSWGSTGKQTGVKSGLASFGSPTYAPYLADAMANSWSRNLGIDGYTIDCSANYPCMMQTKTAQSDFYNKIVGEVRKTQPQVVMSGEGFGSWDQMVSLNTQLGGQGFGAYHTQMQAAVFDGNAEGLEGVAITSGADAATSVCFLHPGYDGKQPGACPTMYFRDQTATIRNLTQHELWVALEAGSGIVSEHDFDPTSVCRTTGPHPFNGCYAAKGAWWNVTNDPRAASGKPSPLWAFTQHRALNRLALRTKLGITSVSSSSSAARKSARPIAGAADSNYTAYPKGHGGVEIGSAMTGKTVATCQAHCTANAKCDCVVFCSSGTCSGTCWQRTKCKPQKFERDPKNAPYTVYVKKNWTPPAPVPPPPVPKVAGGALAYLKHDAMGPRGDACIMVFNPGQAQTVTIDLSSLPPALLSGKLKPTDLFTNTTSATALDKSWSVKMAAGSYAAFGGFSLGVFAPRKGKSGPCKSAYAKPSAATTLQACFLDCANDAKCDNVYVHGASPKWLEKPPPIACTLLGAVADPATACKQPPPSACKSSAGADCGTLVSRLPGARSCAPESATREAVGAPRVASGAPCKGR